MDDMEADNPSVGEDTSVTDTHAAEQEPEYQPQIDADGNPIEEEPEPEEEEEIDLDDLKLKLPKSEAEKLKAAVLRQADYTRKTTALAEAQRSFEAERQSYQEASEAEQTAQAKIHVLDAQLSYYEKVDWNQAFADDPFEAQKAFAQYQMAKDARGQAGNDLTKLQQDRHSKAQQETAKRREQGHAELTKHIKDWGPATAAKLASDGTQHYGFTLEELHAVEDPRIVRALHDAVQWRAHQAKTTKAQGIQKQQEVKPAAKPGRASAPPQGLDDRLSMDEWTKRRNAQLRQRG